MSAYAVDKVLHRLVLDPEFRDRLRADPTTALDEVEPPLDGGEREALAAGDVGRLSRDGATSFLLWQLARFELFGLDNDIYADRIRTEYAAERERMRAAGLLG
jgi:hypothetical protein